LPAFSALFRASSILRVLTPPAARARPRSCLPAPNEEEEAQFELVGDPGAKNGEKARRGARALRCGAEEGSVRFGAKTHAVGPDTRTTHGAPAPRAASPRRGCRL
jgi:hypothetical protein